MVKQIVILFTTFAILASAHPAAAQQGGKIRRIGFLSVYAASDPASQRWHQAFREGLRDLGWVAGKNIRIAYRWMARNLTTPMAVSHSRG